MIDITGKTTIISDVHFGKGDNDSKKLQTCLQVIDEVCANAKKYKTDNCFILGDWHDDRRTIGTEVLEKSLESIIKLASLMKVYLIVGNHDMYESDNVTSNTLNAFSYIPNVTVITEPTEIILNGEPALLAPWGTDLSKYKNQFKQIFGHFDISKKFLWDTYIKNNITNLEVDNTIGEKIDSDDLLSDDVSYKPKDDVKYMNSVLDIITDAVFTGHIHNHSEKIICGKRVIFVGSPYQQDAGERDSIDGMYVLNIDGTYEFVELNAPRYKQIYVSDIISSGTDAYDYGSLKGHIVKLIYDVIVDDEQVAEITKNVANACPFDTATPDFRAKPTDDENDNLMLEEFRLGKFTLIENHMNGIPDNILTENSVRRDKIMTMLKEGFDSVIGKENEE